MVKTSEGVFTPSYESDFDKAKLFKINKEYSFSAQAIDIVALHRKYFALISMLFDSQEEYKQINEFRKNLEFDAGYFKIIELSGTKFKIPGSVALGKIEEEERINLYNEVLKIAYEKYALDNETIENNLNDFM